jgi:hypothetical protein
MSESVAPAIEPAPSSGKSWRLPPTPYHGLGSFTVSDLIVIIGGIVLLFAGWALQRAHDARLESAEIAGIHLAYPEGWLPLPVMPQAVAQWTDNQGFGATLTLFAEPANSGSAYFSLTSPNPAVAQAAYTPMRSEPVTVGNVSAIRSDYAYARRQVASSSPPEIVRGREVSWTANDQRYALVLEAPEQDWSRVQPLFDSLAAAAITAGGTT